MWCCKPVIRSGTLERSEERRCQAFPQVPVREREIERQVVVVKKQEPRKMVFKKEVRVYETNLSHKHASHTSYFALCSFYGVNDVR